MGEHVINLDGKNIRFCEIESTRYFSSSDLCFALGLSPHTGPAYKALNDANKGKERKYHLFSSDFGQVLRLRVIPVEVIEDFTSILTKLPSVETRIKNNAIKLISQLKIQKAFSMWKEGVGDIDFKNIRDPRSSSNDKYKGIEWIENKQGNLSTRTNGRAAAVSIRTHGKQTTLRINKKATELLPEKIQSVREARIGFDNDRIVIAFCGYGGFFPKMERSENNKGINILLNDEVLRKLKRLDWGLPSVSFNIEYDTEYNCLKIAK